VHLAAEGTLHFVAGENPLTDHWPQDYRPTGAGTLDAGKVIVVPHPEDSETFAPGVGMPDVLRAGGVHSILAAPIRSKGSSLGSFICYFDHPRQFDEEAVPLAEALANQTAQALQRARFEEALRRAALHDELTGLPSRRLIEEQVADALVVDATMPAVMFIDLDGFKRVNDTLGHAAGDVLLTQVGQRLRGVVRDGDLVGRFGGDEFIAVAQVHDTKEAAAIAERIRAALDTPFVGIEERLRVTASIGVTVATTREDLVLDRLVRTADQTMYRAKLAGGNRIAIAVDDQITILTPAGGASEPAPVGSW
jgi:diguanylate cyclase (GGDEF)-like protein